MNSFNIKIHNIKQNKNIVQVLHCHGQNLYQVHALLRSLSSTLQYVHCNYHIQKHEHHLVSTRGNLKSIVLFRDIEHQHITFQQQL